MRRSRERVGDRPRRVRVCLRGRAARNAAAARAAGAASEPGVEGSRAARDGADRHDVCPVLSCSSPPRDVPDTQNSEFRQMSARVICSIASWRTTAPRRPPPRSAAPGGADDARADRRWFRLPGGRVSADGGRRSPLRRARPTPAATEGQRALRRRRAASPWTSPSCAGSWSPRARARFPCRSL